MVTKEFVERAKTEYGVGTIFYPPHIKGSDSYPCIVTEDDKLEISDTFIMLSSGNHKKNGHSYSEVIYHVSWGWAERQIPEVNNHYPIY